MPSHKVEQPRHKIVSMRLRDDEWENLHTQCTQAHKTVSEFMREMLLPHETDYCNSIGTLEP